MTSKEDSSFLQGVESRLDALFGEDSGSSAKPKDPVVPKPEVKDIPAHAEVAPEVKEDIREIPIVKAPGFESAMAAEKIQPQDKSTFISEIEKRFSAIFGEDEKEAAPAKAVEKPAGIPDIEPQVKPDIVVEAPPFRMPEPVAEIIPQAIPDIPAVAAPPVMAAQTVRPAPQHEEVASDFVAPMSSIFNSPLKDMKSIVLSIEWEISDHILEQFDEEINKLYLLYTGNRIIQGFLRILRFLGRYIRVRGVSSNQDSINLLLSVYDHLETVMISEEMTEARKHISLIDNIKKYRAWVETTDIVEGAAETMAPTPGIELEKAPVEIPPAEALPAFELPPLDLKPAKAFEEPDQLARPQLEPKEEIEFAIKEPEVLLQQPPAPSVLSFETQEHIMDMMKNMPVEEAVKYAVEKIKSSYQAQLDALQEEIRVLKSSR